MTDESEDNVVEHLSNNRIKINNTECLNFGSYNFLNMIMDKKQAGEANEAIKKYGIGSCGPRGFFGTFDAHLNLEKQISDFLGVQSAIIYRLA